MSRSPTWSRQVPSLGGTGPPDPSEGERDGTATTQDSCPRPGWSPRSQSCCGGRPHFRAGAGVWSALAPVWVEWWGRRTATSRRHPIGTESGQPPEADGIRCRSSRWARSRTRSSALTRRRSPAGRPGRSVRVSFLRQYLSAKQVGQDAGVAADSVSRYRRGARKHARPDVAAKIEAMVRERRRPRVRKRGQRHAATTGGITVETRARFGCTAPVGTTADGRFRCLTVDLPAAYAQRLFDAHDAGAGDQGMRGIIAEGFGRCPTWQVSRASCSRSGRRPWPGFCSASRRGPRKGS